MISLSRKSLILTFLGLFSLILAGTALAQVKEAPTRDQIEDKYKWNLSDYYPSDEAWEASLKILEQQIPQMGTYQGKLGDSPATLAEALKMNDSLGSLAHRLYVYASLNLDEDNRVGKYQEMKGRIFQMYTRLGEAASYLEPEILKIPNEKLEAFLKENAALGVYRFYISDMIRRKAHIMNEETENLLSMAGSVTSGPSNIFTMLDDADIKFPNVKDDDGNEVELTDGRYSQLLQSTNREVRKAASDAYNDTYLKYQNGLAACLASSVNGDVFYTRARKYNTCLERALDGDNIPTVVYNNLIEVASSNLAPLHKYVAMRKKYMALDTLYPYDMYVPLVPEARRKIPYEEGKKIVLDALKPLGNDYIKSLNVAFDSRWIDVYETQAKGSGAYSWGTYSAHPVVLLNYSDELGDVFTLGHELGHAMHRYYTTLNEPYIYAGHSIFAAEVASTCNETIIIDYLLKKAKTREEKLYLLNYHIEQIMGTFYSQVYFSEFEQKIHDVVENGGALSAESLRQMYREIYQKYFGPDYVIPPDRDLGGLRISHFYRMFYVYQYATSYAASQVLADRIIKGDKKATEAYLEFIKTGSSDYPVNVLKKAGIDMTTPQPYENVIAIFSRLVNEMEKLLLES